MSNVEPLSESEPSRSAALREAVIASLGVLLMLGAVKHLGAVLPDDLEGWLYTAVFAVQLYVPLARVGRNGISLASLGLRLDRYRRDLRDFGVAALATGVPYALVFHLWQTLGLDRSFALAWPDRFVEQVFVEVCVIALAEELFFRGYLQERLSLVFPARRRLFGAPFGAAVLLSSAVFAVAHFVGEYHLVRLAPFFPSLVFGLLFARRGTLLAPVAYHAFCNLLADVLFASHRGGS